MQSTLPFGRDLDPFFLYWYSLLTLEKTGTAPRYEEDFVDSSEHQTKMAEFVLRHMCDYDIPPKSNRFRYWHSPTNNDFSRLLLDTLLDLRCSQKKVALGDISGTTQNSSDATELIINVPWGSKKKPIKVSQVLKNNWESMRNEYMAPMTASLLLWLESSPEEKDGE